MRGAHDHPDLAQHAADAVEHPLALDRVRLHQRPLVVVQRAGLVDDRVGDHDLADVVQQRRQLDVVALALVEPQLVGDLQRQRDDAARVVAAGVLVGLLQQVAEQHRDAAVGAAQLERLVEPLVALAREQRQQRGERQHEQERVRVAVGGERREQAERREQRVDDPHPRERSQLLAAGDVEREPRAHRVDAEVDRELGAERQHVPRPVAPLRDRRAGRPAARPPGPSRATRRRAASARGRDGARRARSRAGCRRASRAARAAARAASAAGTASARTPAASARCGRRRRGSARARAPRRTARARSPARPAEACRGRSRAARARSPPRGTARRRPARRGTRATSAPRRVPGGAQPAAAGGSRRAAAARERRAAPPAPRVPDQRGHLSGIGSPGIQPPGCAKGG